MAIVFTNQSVPSFNDTGQLSTYVGASWTPTLNDVVLATVITSDPSSTAVPTVSGNGLKWSKIITLPYDTSGAPVKRITLFRAFVFIVGSGPITVNYAGDQQNGTALIITSVAGCLVTGDNAEDAIVQYATNFNDSNQTAGSVTLTTFANNDNAVFACFAVNQTITTFTPETNYTAGTAQSYLTPAHSAFAEWQTKSDTFVNASWDTTGHWGGIAIELANANPNVITNVFDGVVGAGLNLNEYVRTIIFLPTSITHGPFVGGVTSTTANFFVRTDVSGKFTFKYGTASDLSGSTNSEQLTSSDVDNTVIISITGLIENTKYYYQAVGDVTSSLIHSFTTFPSSPTSLKFVMLTDFQNMSTSPVIPIEAFVNADAENPNFVFIGGDFDHSDPGVGGNESLSRTQTRDMWKRLYDPNLMDIGGQGFITNILRKYPTCHVWDDHDYASNNNDKDYNWKDTVAKAEYTHYYPSYTLPTIAGGIWQNFSYGTLAEFFLLDSRSQKDPNSTVDDKNKSLLDGDAFGITGQKQWLKDKLLASTATWKIIAAQVPWNPTAFKFGAGTNYENWYGFKYEQNELTTFIRDNHITGIVLLSGDVHFGALDNGYNSVFPEIIGPPPNFISGGGELCNGLDEVGLWTNGTWDNGGGAI